MALSTTRRCVDLDAAPSRRAISPGLLSRFGAALAILIPTCAGCGTPDNHLTVQTAEVWPGASSASLEFSYILGELLRDGWPAREIDDIAAATADVLDQGSEGESLPNPAVTGFEARPTEIRCSEFRLDRECEGAAPAYCNDPPPADAVAMTPVATARRGQWRVRGFKLNECPRD